MYQRSLEKTSLKIKTINQLFQMKQEAFIKYKQAKEMKLYGVMGHRAQIMCDIDKELGKKHLLHQKQKNTFGKNIKVQALYNPIR
jgi:hypothetical protein